MIQEGDLVRIKTMKELSKDYNVENGCIEGVDPGFTPRMTSMCDNYYKVGAVTLDNLIGIEGYLFRQDWVEPFYDSVDTVLRRIKK